MGMVLFYSNMLGCAQQPRGGSHHEANFQSNFAARLDIAVDYIRDDNRAILICDISNPRGQWLRVWLVQKSTTDGQRISAARRFYEGNDKKYQETFRLPLPDKGVREEMYVEVFDSSGKVLMKTKSIINQPKEGKL